MTCVRRDDAAGSPTRARGRRRPEARVPAAATRRAVGVRQRAGLRAKVVAVPHRAARSLRSAPRSAAGGRTTRALTTPPTPSPPRPSAAGGRRTRRTRGERKRGLREPPFSRARRRWASGGEEGGGGQRAIERHAERAAVGKPLPPCSDDSRSSFSHSRSELAAGRTPPPTATTNPDSPPSHGHGWAERGFGAVERLAFWEGSNER